ncbi:MAG: enoyl-ACP reductase [Gammaproteobacteria bacterium]|nr:enoyl-ACP reductase [Gammaproteobacteria bacterium]MYD01779.1 enoyl-ACP reductase [Gammaproteobacteria bacterium]MYI25221.1 enoyl-ACP reductase [Gammaproteobacteria bacterium]
MPILEGKRALIAGIASKRSIAWGIARSFHREGAEVALSALPGRMLERAESFAPEVDAPFCLGMDVSSDQSIEEAFAQLRESWSGLDILVHSIAFAPGDNLKGDFADSVSRDGFRISHDVSAYSFAALARAATPLMADGGTLLTLSYSGSTRAVKNYNVMGPAKASLEAVTRALAMDLGKKGIRVNALSPGPVKTLSAAGIPNFRKMLHRYEAAAPLRRNVTLDEVGNAAVFLCSEMASGITGVVLQVDAGMGAVGLAFPD